MRYFAIDMVKLCCTHLLHHSIVSFEIHGAVFGFGLMLCCVVLCGEFSGGRGGGSIGLLVCLLGVFGGFGEGFLFCCYLSSN